MKGMMMQMTTLTQIHDCAEAIVTAILKRYPNIYFTTFRHNVHKTTWYEVPFGFEPFWQEAEAASKRIESTKSYEGVTE